MAEHREMHPVETTSEMTLHKHGSVGPTLEVLSWDHFYCSNARYLGSFQVLKFLHKPWLPSLKFT